MTQDHIIKMEIDETRKPEIECDIDTIIPIKVSLVKEFKKKLEVLAEKNSRTIEEEAVDIIVKKLMNSQ